MTNENKKKYRDIVLPYIEKLGEIDKLENELFEKKREASELKKEIDNFKRRKTNE
jgi:molecular chaperone GrpE (heat shock protein)